MQEAQSPKYLIDGWFLKQFKIWPDGCDPEGFTPEQKKFAIYLIAFAPSEDTLRHYVRYEARKAEIQATDYGPHILKVTSRVVLETMARARKVPFAEFMAAQQDEVRKRELVKLRDHYSEFLNLEDDTVEDPRVARLKRYAELSKRLTREIQDPKAENIKKLFDRPAGLRPVAKPDGQ